MSQSSTGGAAGKETTMGYGRCVGRVGALAVATRMTVSIGVAALVVVATVVPAPTVSPAVRLAASTAPCTRTDVTCALILGGTSIPTPNDAYVEIVRNQYIEPTHPGQNIEYVAVTTPEELWPITGLFRLVGLGLLAWPARVPRACCRSVAGRAVVETLGALRPHRGSVGAGRGGRSGGGDGRAPQRPSGDLRLLAGRGRREPGEAQARRAVPGGNQGPRYRLRAGR